MNRESKISLKITAVCCLISLLLALTIGCSGTATTGTTAAASTAAATTTAATTTVAKPVNISIMSINFATEAPKGDGAVQKKIEEYTNTKLDITWVPSSVNYEEKIAVSLASGQMPAATVVRTIKREDIINAVRAGQFWEVGSLIKSYPQLNKVNPIVLSDVAIDGKIWGIPRARTIARFGMMVRKDWMKNLGLNDPKTIDDVYNLIKAFTLNDPDKNGQNDTYGTFFLGTPALYELGTIKAWFGAGADWSYANGQMVPDFKTEEYLNALKFARKLYAEKLIPQDFAILKTPQLLEMFNTKGNVGLTMFEIDSADTQQSTLRKTVPTAEIDVYNQITGPKGVNIQPSGSNAGLIMISKSTVKTDTDLKNIMQFFEKLSEPAMQNLLKWGIDGVHCKVTGDKAEFINTTTFASEVGPFAQLGTQYSDEYYQQINKTAVQTKVDLLTKVEGPKYLLVNPVTPLISKTNSEKGTTLTQAITDAKVKFVMGSLDEAGWQKAVEQWSKDGGDLIAAEYLAEYKKSQS